MRWRCLNNAFGYCKVKPKFGKKRIVGEKFYRVQVDVCKLDWRTCGKYQTQKELMDDKANNNR